MCATISGITLTTNATIYNITTTVVDDITCTTNRSTIEEEVDDVSIKSSHDLPNNIRDLDFDCVTNSIDITNINTDNNIRPDLLYLLCDVNAIQ